MSQYFTFHLNWGGKRTSVSLDLELAKYLATSLKVEPGSRAAKTKIREWAAKSLAEDEGLDKHFPLSAQVRRLAIRKVVDPRYLEQPDSHGQTEPDAQPVQSWRERLKNKGSKR